MQLSKKKINRNLEKQIEEMLFGVLAEVKSPITEKQILDDLLTSAERTAVVKRLAIALYLDKGRNYEDVKNNLKVSSATIATVAENLGNPGYQELIRRIKAEDWATEWSDKIGKAVRRVLPV